MTGLAAPALLGFSYHSPDLSRPGPGWTAQVRRWRRIRTRLQLDQPIPNLHVPTDLSWKGLDGCGESSLLAAAERSGPGVQQALVRVEHEVVCFVVMNAPDHDDHDPTAWTELERQWRDAVGEHTHRGVRGGSDALGETAILLGLHPPGIAAAAVVDLLRTAVPSPAPVGWWRSSTDLGDGISLREASVPGHDGRARRRLVVLAPVDQETRVDDLLWTATGNGDLTPLAQFLLHAARLHHQTRVVADARGIRALRERLDSLVDRSHQDGASPAGPGTAELVAELSAVGAVAETTVSRMRQMRHATEIIEANLRALRPTGGGGPLDDDVRLAGWLADRLAGEIWGVGEVRDRATAAARHMAARPPAPAPPATEAVALEAVAPEAVAPEAVAPEAVAAPAIAPTAKAPRRRARPAAGSRTPTRGASRPCAVVLAGLDAAYQAVRDHLGSDFTDVDERGTLYETSVFAGRRHPWSIAIAQVSEGAVAAALQLERAVRRFSPELVVFVGVAGGRAGVGRGDVVVADAIYDYELGKDGEHGFVGHVKTHYPTFRLVQRAQMVAREARWPARVGPAESARPEWSAQPPERLAAPTAVVGPLAAGGKVVAHDRSRTARLIDRHCADALAVETSGHGFLNGAYVNTGVDALVVCGISNLVASRESVDPAWRSAAARHAAAFTVELLDTVTDAATAPYRLPNEQERRP